LKDEIFSGGESVFVPFAFTVFYKKRKEDSRFGAGLAGPASS